MAEKTCIQCNSDVDFLADTFTLYQVDGVRYLYCEKCKSPRELYTSAAEVAFLKDEADRYQKALGRARKFGAVLFFVVFSIGYLVGAY